VVESWDTKWREARADGPGGLEPAAAAPAQPAAGGAGSAAIDAPGAQLQQQ
jgi:hypothetical protein